MSALYGRLENERGSTATRCAHRELTTKAETWKGIVTVDLSKDGSFRVTVSDKDGNHREEIARGNVDSRILEAVRDLKEPESAWTRIGAYKDPVATSSEQAWFYTVNGLWDVESGYFPSEEDALNAARAALAQRSEVSST